MCTNSRGPFGKVRFKFSSVYYSQSLLILRGGFNLFRSLIVLFHIHCTLGPILDHNGFIQKRRYCSIHNNNALVIFFVPLQNTRPPKGDFK